MDLLSTRTLKVLYAEWFVLYIEIINLLLQLGKTLSAKQITTPRSSTKLILFVDLMLLRVAPVAYGSSQARGQISATAAGLYHSHSKSRFKLHL